MVQQGPWWRQEVGCGETCGGHPAQQPGKEGVGLEVLIWLMLPLTFLVERGNVDLDSDGCKAMAAKRWLAASDGCKATAWMGKAMAGLDDQGVEGSRRIGLEFEGWEIVEERVIACTTCQGICLWGDCYCVYDQKRGVVVVRRG